MSEPINLKHHRLGRQMRQNYAERQRLRAQIEMLNTDDPHCLLVELLRAAAQLLEPSDWTIDEACEQLRGEADQ